MTAWDLHPETEAESEEPDEAATLPQDGAPGNVSLTLDGLILDQLRQLREIAEAERADGIAEREERAALRVVVWWAGVVCAIACTGAFLATTSLGLAVLVVLTVR